LVRVHYFIMAEIRPLNSVCYKAVAEILRKANATVASELKLTRENSPTNPAFITDNALREQMNDVRTFYGLYLQESLSGVIALERSKEKGVFFIERLAVLPEYRHKGYGQKLMKHCFNQAGGAGAKYVSVAIINENIKLKKWYESMGFKETGQKKLPHLVFTVCFLQKELY
jgi:diamine N-acetyltransferase